MFDLSKKEMEKGTGLSNVTINTENPVVRKLSDKRSIACRKTKFETTYFCISLNIQINNYKGVIKW